MSTPTQTKVTDHKDTHKEKSAPKFTGATCAEVLADFVHQIEFDDLPGEAVEMSRKMVLDQLGGQLACSVLPWNKEVLKYVEDLAIGSDQSTILNYGVRSAPEYAAFANATFGHGFEVDDFAPRPPRIRGASRFRRRWRSQSGSICPAGTYWRAWLSRPR